MFTLQKTKQNKTKQKQKPSGNKLNIRMEMMQGRVGKPKDGSVQVIQSEKSKKNVFKKPQ